jgi:hypothetical protein
VDTQHLQQLCHSYLEVVSETRSLSWCRVSRCGRTLLKPERELNSDADPVMCTLHEVLWTAVVWRRQVVQRGGRKLGTAEVLNGRWGSNVYESSPAAVPRCETQSRHPPPPPFSCNAWIKISDPFDCGTGSAWHRPTEQDTACGFSGVGLGS